jgi:hypothetical protein
VVLAELQVLLDQSRQPVVAPERVAIPQMEVRPDLIMVQLVDPVVEDLPIPVLSPALVVHQMHQPVSHHHGPVLGLVVQEVQATAAAVAAVPEVRVVEALAAQGEHTSEVFLLKVVLQVNLQISSSPVLEMVEM